MALRVAGGIAPPALGIGAGSEYLARAAEVGTGQRAAGEMTENLGRAMAAQEAINRIIPSPAASTLGGLLKGAGAGAAVSTVAPLVERGELPSPGQLATGTLVGGLLGAGGTKLGQVLQDRAAARQLAGELSDRLGREVKYDPVEISKALDEVHGQEAGMSQALFPPPDVVPNVGPIPEPVVKPPAAPLEAPPAVDVRAAVDELGNFTMPGDQLNKELKGYSDQQVVDLMQWAKGQSPHVERNVAGAGAAELRSRGVPVDQIQWQLENASPEQQQQRMAQAMFPAPATREVTDLLQPLTTPAGPAEKPLAQFLKDRGGLNLKGYYGGTGEQRELLGSKQLPGLFNQQAKLEPHELAQEAADAGYIRQGENDHETTQNLVAALDTDLRATTPEARVRPTAFQDIGAQQAEEVARVKDLRGQFSSLESATEHAYSLMESDPVAARGLLDTIDLAGSSPAYQKLFVEKPGTFASLVEQKLGEETGAIGEQAGISARLQRQRAIEADLAFTNKWQRLMSAKQEEVPGIAKTLTPEDAQMVLDRLNTAPGDNPTVRKAMEDKLAAPLSLRDLLTSESGKITLRSGAVPPLKTDIQGLAERFMSQGIPQDQAVQTAGNLRLDKMLEGVPDTEALRRMQQEVVNSNLPLMEYARRGVRPQEVTKEAALKLGMSEEQLLKRGLGQAQNAEQLLAAGYVADRSAYKLMDVLQGVKAGTATDVQFVEALTKHVAVMEQYSGSVAEAGRALNILRKQREGQIAASQAIQDLFKARDTPQALRAKLGDLMERNPLMFNKTLQDMRQATSFDKLYEVWMNGLLSGPQTHAVNFLSNAATDMWRVAEAGVSGIADAARVAVTGGPRERYVGEALADLHGQVMGLNDAARAALAGWREQPSELGKVEFRHAIAGKLGQAVRMPSRALEASDQFWRTLGSRGSLNALAYRQALQEGLEGTARSQRIAELVANPPDAMKKAVDAEAAYRTFRQEPGSRTATFMRLRNQVPGMKYIVPFVNTPMNIAKFGLERSPLIFLSPGFYQTMKAGGGAAVDAGTKVALGSSLLGLGAYLAGNGIVSGGGPEDPAERQALYATGWQPYSIKVGDQRVSYGRIEPLSMVFGLGADFAEIADKMALEKEDASAALALFPALQRNLSNKTFLKGITDFVEMYNDSGRYFQSWLQSTLGSAIPTGVATAARAMDPTMRSPQGIGESLQARIPGQSQNVPPLRDIWGQPVVRVGNFGELLLSPLRRTVDPQDYPTQELLRLQPIAEATGIAMLPGSPAKALSIKGQKMEMTREEYDAYVETSGGLARRLWETVVSNKTYQEMPDGEKAQMANKVFDKAREAARKLTLVQIGMKRPASLRALLEKGLELRMHP
jgi:hypothetical protein